MEDLLERITPFAVKINAYESHRSDPLAEDIIEKCFRAMGGRDRLSGIKTMKTAGTISIMGMTGTFTLNISDPAFRYEISLNSEGMNMTMIIAYDGRRGWMVNPLTNDVEDLPEEQLEIFKNSTTLSENPMTLIRDSKLEVTFDGEERVDNRTCHKLRLQNEEGAEQFLYIDAENYLLLKLVQAQDAMTKVEMNFRNYQKIAGDWMAHETEMKVADASIMDMKLLRVKTNVDIDDAIFEAPSR